MRSLMVNAGNDADAGHSRKGIYGPPGALSAAACAEAQLPGRIGAGTVDGDVESLDPARLGRYDAAGVCATAFNDGQTIAYAAE